MRRFHPLYGVPNQGQVWAWVAYKVAGQAFTLIIVSLLFPIFFKEVIAGKGSNGEVLWSWMAAISSFLAVLASPILGAVADSRGWKKRLLLLTGYGCALLTCALGFVPAGAVALTMVLYIAANALYSLGENFAASFIPELTQREHFGRVSGTAWACGYVAALVLLVLTAGSMKLLGTTSTSQWRPYFLMAGLWFAALMLPTLRVLRERPAPPLKPWSQRPNLVREGFRRLWHSVRQVRQFRDLTTLLVAFFFYGMAMNVVISFAGFIVLDFHFDQVLLVGFVAVLTAAGIIGTLLPTFVQDRFGHRLTCLVLLALWIGTIVALAFYAHRWETAADKEAVPRWPLWVLGSLLGLGLGSLGSANRAFVGYLTPVHRSAEFFGIWGMVYRLGAIGTIPFAWVKAEMGMTASLAVLAGFVLVGLLLTLLVKEQRGAAAARAADAEAEAEGARIVRAREA